MPVNNPIQFAEIHWSIQLKRASGDEYVGPCPNCRQGDDRFHVWETKQNFWCRQCGYAGFLDALESATRMTKDEMVEWRLRQLERERIEHERRLSALEQMHNCKDHLRYHFDMTTEQMEYWLDEGMTVDTIAVYQLGWCPRCPTDYDGRASYTIPVYDRDNATLINIRHRLMAADGGDKYRPHMAGLGQQLFNARFTTEQLDDIIVTEGEKKSVILAQERLPNVGIMGKRSFKKEWMEWLQPFKRVYVALDPDATESANRLATMFDGRGYIVPLPVKADDFFVRYGGTRDDFKWFMGRARPTKAH